MIDDLNSFIISTKCRLILSCDISRRLVLKGKRRKKQNLFPTRRLKKFIYFAIKFRIQPRTSSDKGKLSRAVVQCVLDLFSIRLSRGSVSRDSERTHADTTRCNLSLCRLGSRLAVALKAKLLIKK